MTTDPLPVNIDTHRTETLNRNLRHKVTDTQVSCDLLSSGRYWFRQLFSSPIMSVVQLKIFASFNLFTPIDSQWSALQSKFWLRGDPDESWSANRLKPRESRDSTETHISKKSWPSASYKWHESSDSVISINKVGTTAVDPMSHFAVRWKAARSRRFEAAGNVANRPLAPNKSQENH